MKLVKIFFLLFTIILLSSCNSKSDKNLFNDAQKLVEHEKYSEAINKYEQIVKEFPKSTNAPESLFEMAKIYQGQVIKNINSKESLQKAVAMYKKIFAEYPDSRRAESSIFMAAFILANELQDINAAKSAYNLYIQKYPNGELVKDAKIELQNLGKSPEEVLRDKIKPKSKNESAK
jgi:TolA-binding protein